MVKSFDAQLKESMDELLKRKRVLEDCEYALEKAKKAYDEYNKKVVAELMHNNGLEEVKLSSGLTAQVKTKTYASVNREKIAQVADWLEKNDGGHLIKKDITVGEQYMLELEAMQIPFKKNMNVNTTSLKAFLLDKMGQKGGYAYINPDSLPEGISFFQEDVIEFKENS